MSLQRVSISGQPRREAAKRRLLFLSFSILILTTPIPQSTHLPMSDTPSNAPCVGPSQTEIIGIEDDDPRTTESHECLVPLPDPGRQGEGVLLVRPSEEAPSRHQAAHSPVTPSHGRELLHPFGH